MEPLGSVTRPGLMLSQVWPRSRETTGATVRALEAALATGVFTTYQTVEIPDRDERRAFAAVAGGALHIYCLARVLNERRLSLSSLDPTLCRESCDAVFRCLDDAREAGAAHVALVSGARPEREEDHEPALAALTESLASIIARASEDPPLGVLIEPLDSHAHKRMTLGSIRQAIGICDELERGGLRLGLTLDSAHSILNGESPIESLRLALRHVFDFHYCNCVVDPAHPLYGDHHLPFGPPGVVDLAAVAQMMRGQLGAGYFSRSRRPPVMCEVLLRDGDDSPALMRYCAETMTSAWRLAQSAELTEEADDLVRQGQDADR